MKFESICRPVNEMGLQVQNNLHILLTNFTDSYNKITYIGLDKTGTLDQNDIIMHYLVSLLSTDIDTEISDSSTFACQSGHWFLLNQETFTGEDTIIPLRRK